MKKKLFLYILFAILIIIAISFIVLLILNFQVNNRLKIIHEDYYNNACNNMNEIGKEQFFINLFNQVGENISQYNPEQMKNLTKVLKILQPFFNSGGCFGELFHYNYYIQYSPSIYYKQKASIFETFEALDDLNNNHGNSYFSIICPWGKDYIFINQNKSLICK